jgi:hypothetical protein
MSRLSAWCLLLAFGPTLGCTANVRGEAGDPNPGVAGGSSTAGSAATVTAPGMPSEWRPGVLGDPRAAGYMPLRQLNRLEYRNALAELFGDAQKLDQLLPGDVAGTSGFATAGLASEVTVLAFQQAAEQLAASADINALTGCAAGAGAASATCIDTLLRDFGQHAFRRPLSDAEASEFKALYGSLTNELGMSFESAARTLLEALLQAPAFLYHWELGPAAPVRDADGAVKLGGYELSSRLSFLLWSSIPDQELLQAAASGALDTAPGIEAQARRLLASDKALGTMRNFHLQWLEVALQGTTKSAELYPSFGPALAQAMEDELTSLSGDLYRSGGTVRELFQSPKAFVTPDLATLYGLTGVAGTAASARSLDATRPGLLTRAGFLASTSNAYEGDPTKRGAVIRRRVLCGSLTPPPANVPDLPASSAAQTVRERHAMHMGVEPCKTCHALTDPIGFGLGNFDAIGAYHTEESGKLIDASGSVAGLDGADRSFNDVAGLMGLLAESEDVRACLTKQWLRFGFARSETRADDSSLQSAYQAFAASGYRLSELLVALTTARSFRYRAVSPGEVLK